MGLPRESAQDPALKDEGGEVVDTKLLFQKIGLKMRADFEASAQIKHSGSKGTVRENVLRTFLAEGRLPTKYGLGSGEIVGRVRNTSRQCDVVVYDKLNGVTLLYDDAIQVYPVDCVYGIIEVKSALSKAEFIDALEKIKAFKAMAPGGMVSRSMGGGMTMFHPRPLQFGLIFAYCLADNSLYSLYQNLREWEAETSPALWPNYVCVLESGVIYHHGEGFRSCLDSEKITDNTSPIYLNYGEDSLFHFYCALHDLCGHMQLGPVELSHYYDPALQIGKHIVHGRGVEGQFMKDGATVNVRLTESAIDNVVAWCAAHGRLRYRDVLIRRFGSLPVGMEKAPNMDLEVYLYNPDDLPGLHELGPNPFITTERGVTTSAPSLANALELQIDGNLYVIAHFKDADYEPC